LWPICQIAKRAIIPSLALHCNAIRVPANIPEKIPCQTILLLYKIEVMSTYAFPAKRLLLTSPCSGEAVRHAVALVVVPVVVSVVVPMPARV
jgi:hypothetical protein